MALFFKNPDFFFFLVKEFKEFELCRVNKMCAVLYPLLHNTLSNKLLLRNELPG